MYTTASPLSAHEIAEVEQANATGLTPVAFIHGWGDTALAFVKRFV
jgi:hypothetical protein